MKTRWTSEEAWTWYQSRPWVMGINYVPSITLNGIELWQEDTYDEVMTCVRRELALMQDIGINSVRMFLPFNVWYYERDRFLDRLDLFFSELDANGISIMPVFFSDCVNFGRPADIQPRRPGGWRPYDIGHHSGRKENPFTGERERVGWIYWDEPEWRPVVEEYLRSVIGRFRDDPRIEAWDLWNEPGNCNRGGMSIPYLQRAFEVARSMDPLQPLTSGPWLYPPAYGVDPAVQLEPIQQLALEESDIVTFHHYGSINEINNVLIGLKRQNRPIMNTEWLNRILGNTVSDNLPLYHAEGIGSYSWGLVAGKSQHFLPWDDLWNRRDLPLHLWQHDLFDVYHTPYDPQELALMQSLHPPKRR